MRAIWSKESGHSDQKFGHFTYSQHGEDLFVLNLFKLLGIEKGRYLDIGAYHPLNISNTALLYERGWRGVNVEANPYLHDDFKLYRPDDTILNVGIAGEAGSKNFFMYDRTSVTNTFSEKERDLFLNEHPSFSIQEKPIIQMMTINHVVETYFNGMWPDFVTVDVEGLDYEIIKSIQFPNHFTNRPHMFCIEIRKDEERFLKEHMNHLGYFSLVRMISNLIFIRNDHLELVR